MNSRKNLGTGGLPPSQVYAKTGYLAPQDLRLLALVSSAEADSIYPAHVTQHFVLG